MEHFGMRGEEFSRVRFFEEELGYRVIYEDEDLTVYIP
jgi:hypothetical protein